MTRCFSWSPQHCCLWESHFSFKLGLRATPLICRISADHPKNLAFSMTRRVVLGSPWMDKIIREGKKLWIISTYRYSPSLLSVTSYVRKGECWYWKIDSRDHHITKLPAFRAKTQPQKHRIFRLDLRVPKVSTLYSLPTRGSEGKKRNFDLGGNRWVDLWNCGYCIRWDAK